MSSFGRLINKVQIDVSDATYDELRKKLFLHGRGDEVVENNLCRMIDAGGFVIRNRYVARHRAQEQLS